MSRRAFLLATAVVLLLSGVALAAPAQQPLIADQKLYAVDPQPLTLAQCGQCHPQHFKEIKREGGRHQFDCRGCHAIFHAYNPRKNNYAELMPACTNCHDLVHGERHTVCLNCHSNPHAAARAPAIAGVSQFCSDCHQEQQAQLVVLPSRHTQLSCDSCHHTRHGLIPSCEECHQPHFDGQPMTSCSACHDVHQPLVIALGKNVDLRTCSDCHQDIYGKWQKTTSKHGQVGCSECHGQHKQIPDCRSCHGIPPAHSPAMLKKFPRCLDCHLDVHDLPTKN
ncbi:MAG: cytochrome C [Desulfuromonadales bacterium]|nr:cytochrome C [Desulfuromonadales bacterium]MBN2791502.1 cytochrome C [Desulfuromonadales bacterium]